MPQNTPIDNGYNLDTTGLSLAPSEDDEPGQLLPKARSKNRGLINDTPVKTEKRRIVRRTGSDRRDEIRFECEDRRRAGGGRRAAERHWQSVDRK